MTDKELKTLKDNLRRRGGRAAQRGAFGGEQIWSADPRPDLPSIC